ncbi:MAG: gliding motility-associated C-terminal domain-containing protein [Saprospiraceae bacterium]|nr:gliding motility-associated C-terminal domain-containing protein [Saprospiraceae bacterium]
MSRFLALAILFGSVTGLMAQNQGCQSAFTLGQDTVLCFPDSQVIVRANSAWEVLSLQWLPGPGAVILDSAAVSVTTTSTGWVRAIAAMRSPNLILNGDFSQGNSGFSSDLIHSPFTLIPPSTYAITTDPASIHPDFLPCQDHTTGTGRMLASNGNIFANRDVWCQTVAVEPSGVYELSFWASALTENELPELVFRIDGQNLTTPLVPGPDLCDWKEATLSWTAGMQTSAEICIRNLNGSNSGNDFALDDIVMIQYCTADDTVFVRHQPLRETVVDTLLCKGQVLEAAGQVFDVTTSGIWAFPDAAGCDSLVRIELEVIDPGLGIQTPDTLTCIDTLVRLEAFAGWTGPGQSFRWFGPDGQPLPGGDIPAVEVNAGGMYSVAWTLSDPKGSCVQMLDVQVFVNKNAPQADAGQDLALTCMDDTVWLQAGVSIPGWLYQWTVPPGAASIPDGTSAWPVTAPGTYLLEVSDPANGCTARDTVIVQDERRQIGPVEVVITQPVCQTDNGVIEVLGVGNAEAPLALVLTDATGGEWTGAGSFSGLTGGPYTLHVTDADGCQAALQIEMPTGLQPLITLPEGLSAEAGASILVQPQFNFLPGDVKAFSWSSEGFQVDCATCPVVEVSGWGEALLRLCVELSPDCTVCDSVAVSFTTGNVLYVPGAFSPNGDGVNDVFRPFPASGVVSAFRRLAIYDRWGGLLHEWVGESPDPPSWDGTKAGDRLDPGVFVYHLVALMTGGVEMSWSGEIFLLK